MTRYVTVLNFQYVCKRVILYCCSLMNYNCELGHEQQVRFYGRVVYGRDTQTQRS